MSAPLPVEGYEIRHILGDCHCTEDNMSCWYWRTRACITKENAPEDEYVLSGLLYPFQESALLAWRDRAVLDARIDERNRVWNDLDSKTFSQYTDWRKEHDRISIKNKTRLAELEYGENPRRAPEGKKNEQQDEHPRA